MIQPDEEMEKFSDDPDEQLKMENEILKLKLNAELGGKFESLSEVPAEIENFFLKNVIAFEHEHAKSEIKTVYDVLGKPAFTASAELNDEEIEAALQDLETLMEEKSIMVDYLVEYPARLKYTFLTEELFNHESSLFSMPGMTTHYIYEEFHPNHEYEIRQCTENFIQGWFDKQFNEYNCKLANGFELPGKGMLSPEEVMNKIQWMFDSYTAFYDATSSTQTIEFTLNTDGTGSGFSEGFVSYSALMENNEEVQVEGRFKLMFTMESNYWQINYFTWPGFKW